MPPVPHFPRPHDRVVATDHRAMDKLRYPRRSILIGECIERRQRKVEVECVRGLAHQRPRIAPHVVDIRQARHGGLDGARSAVQPVLMTRDVAELDAHHEGLVVTEQSLGSAVV